MEVALEPGPAQKSIFGGNVAGRMCMHIGGKVVGDVEEPLCVFRALSQHLVKLAALGNVLWAPELAGRKPREQFQILDDCMFTGALDDCPTHLRQSLFLTNVSEAFDGVKGFVVSPKDGEVLFLLQWVDTGVFLSQVIPYTEFSSVTSAFAEWVQGQEQKLLGNSEV